MSQKQKPSKPLFSQHFLDRRLPELPEWGEEVGTPLAQLQRLYEHKKPFLSTLNEAQTESELLQPILEILGFSYINQVKTSSKGRAERPDYALFASNADKMGAFSLQQDETAFYSRVVAITEAKYWERPLSKVSRNDGRDIFQNVNPSFQIVNYLIGTGVDWGILTNGREWRLYYRQASSKAKESYDVDLVEILESRDLEQFKYFWLFFRKDAFIPDSQAKNFLDRVREGSTTYATQVEGQLKKLVFEEIFPDLAGGFVAYGQIQGQSLDGSQVYAATLSFLYKILFLLYAEAKNLLPIDGDYRHYSLIQMTQEIGERRDRASAVSETVTGWYDRLLGLFQIIDRGDRGLQVPRYDGGLFHCDFATESNRQDYPENWFLQQYKLADAVLGPALDKLARIQGEPVDYSFLGVRQLGSIYEGLLEYRLVIDDAIAGKTHLENDKGERKATGSYYTPDYIVKYIVKHTLTPILEERKGQFEALMGQIGSIRQRMQDKRLGSQSLRGLERELKGIEKRAIATLLDIRVCDPAMGSGHFLVEAVDFLTDEIASILTEFAANPVLAMLEEIRGEIVVNLSQQGIRIDPELLKDEDLLHRVVMKRCIYGVDLNKMAVELAKVSLWLHSFTIGAPLSFLNHHLRWGNSLIGTTAKEAEAAMQQEESGQLLLLTGPFAGLLQAAEIMRGISTLSDATFAEVEQSERLFRDFDAAAKPYKQLLDIYVAQYFGVKRAENVLRVYGAKAINADVSKLSKKDAAVFKEAEKLRQEKRFFHWDLEFPEVFVDLDNASWKENPGFDAVIGNPPYVNVLNLAKDERDYLLEMYDFAQGRVDVYISFFEKALTLIKTNGICGVITPNKYFVYGYGSKLRKKLANETTILSLVDLAKAASIFPEAATYTVISIIKNQIPKYNHLIETAIFLKDNPSLILDFKTAVLENACTHKFIPQSRFLQTPINVFSLWLSDIRWSIYEKVKRLSLLIEEQFNIEQCIRIGSKKLREELIVSAKQKSNIPKSNQVLLRRIIDAEEVEKYFVNWQERYLIYDKKRLYNPKSEELFRQKKVIVKDASTHLIVGLDSNHEDPYFALNTIYVIVPNANAVVDIRFLAAVLNSPISNFLYKLLFGALTIRGGYIRFREYLQYLPIKRINFTTQPENRQSHVQNLISLYTQFQSNSNSEPLLQQVEHHLNQKPEEADVIHDLLAYLAEQMIEMNQEKQVEIKSFLKWLGREIDCEIDNLTNKTTVKNYLGDYQRGRSPLTSLNKGGTMIQDLGEPHLSFAELLKILKKNQKKLSVVPSARKFQETIEPEYQASLDKLLPLKQKLIQCDRLINAIVYKLYGLTEEEIAIVEGKNS